MIMKTYLSYSLVLLLMLLTGTSCTKEHLEANGQKISDLRTPGVFTGIVSSGATPVHISYGPTCRVEVRGSSNLVPYFQTKLFNRTLTLTYQRVNVRHDDVEVFVTLPDLAHTDISGSGSMDISGDFPLLDDFSARISGSGDIIALSPITCTAVDVNISGSGTADFGKMTSRNVEVGISGSGKAYLSVTETLKARISGSGSIFYSGNPQIDSKISGSGKLVKR